MSGHSKWSTIKRKKGAADAKRGKIFSRLAKEITIAAKMGGGDPDGNPRLRTVLLAAKGQNMPKENVERAIKKGTGELEGVTYHEIRYECYGPGGVAFLIDTLTDNKNRTISEIRQAVGKQGGSMAETGAVLWNFEPKGQISVARGDASEEDLFDKGIEAGADDVSLDGDICIVTTEGGDLHSVAAALEEAGLAVDDAQLVMTPKTTVEVKGKQAEQVLRFLDAIEDLDDVQNIFGNFDIPDEEMAALVG
jgi:YebC/PmpR family DNA-binding regulatory protein